jgi:small subunit ribosomal protein S4
MSGLNGPVGKISRRLGVGITAKGARVLQRRPNPPGQHGARAKTKKLSTYGLQLLEKQKLRAFYGLRERQFRRFFEKAQKMTGATGDNLLGLLERRLDNVVYRRGFAATRAQARQLVCHGHFAVNGVPTDIPSYLISQGDELTVRETSRKNRYFTELTGGRTLSSAQVPEWLTVGSEDPLSLRVATLPGAQHAEPAVDVQAVIEFYSR